MLRPSLVTSFLHGGLELFLVHCSAVVGVNLAPDLVDELLGLFLVLLGHVGVDTVVSLLLGHFSILVGVACVYYFGGRGAIFELG